jgi:hypothetical protein
MCHASEYYRAAPTITPPAAGAWIDASAYQRTSGGADVETSMATESLGRYAGFHEQINCGNWTLTTYSSGTAYGDKITSNGVTYEACATALAVACCD